MNISSFKKWMITSQILAIVMKKEYWIFKVTILSICAFFHSSVFCQVTKHKTGLICSLFDRKSVLNCINICKKTRANIVNTCVNCANESQLVTLKIMVILVWTKCWKMFIFLTQKMEVLRKIKLLIVKMRMFDIHKDIWSLGFPFIL